MKLRTWSFDFNNDDYREGIVIYHVPVEVEVHNEDDASENAHIITWVSDDGTVNQNVTELHQL